MILRLWGQIMWKSGRQCVGALVLKVHLKSGSFIKLALHVNFSAECGNLGLDQIKTKSLTFHMGMKSFVKREHVLLVFAEINTKTIVRNNQAYKVWLNLRREGYYRNSGWVPVFNRVA
jgi:hypothetical protein